MKTISYIITGMMIVGLMSCNEYLEHKPSKTTSLVPETTEHLDYLMNEYYYTRQEGNDAVIYGSDDYGLYKELYDAYSGAYYITDIMWATWDVDYLPDQLNNWSVEYEKVFQANMVLSYLDRVSGSQEDKARLKADAHFMRAYSFWNLANTYCLPYTEENKDEMGIVLKQTTSFEENMERATLAKTYEMIESDLEEALKIKTTFSEGNRRIWRSSLPAVYAFAARYYLNRNNYTEALNYAEKALDEWDELMDYNTDMYFSENKDEITINPNTSEAQVVEIQYPYTYEGEYEFSIALEWKELYYLRFLYNASEWFLPSKELMDLYDKQYDLRWKFHYVPNFSYTYGLTSPAYAWPGYVFFGDHYILSGPTTAEMLLIKAECQARQGNWQEAMNTVNILRAKRMDANAPVDVINLSATSQQEAIQKILEERRREMPFSARWFDIRRFNNNEDPNDDVERLTREFYPYTATGILDKEALKTYTKKKNSRRFAAPLLNTEIEHSLGAIKQNIY